MTKISILTIFLAKPNINTKRLWQKSSEKIAQFSTAAAERSLRRLRQRKRQKTCKTTTLHVHHALLYISFPSLQDYNVKMPNFRFNEERKQTKTNLSFSFFPWVSLTHSSSSDPGWDTRLKGNGFYEFHSRRVHPYLTSKRVWIIVLK